jgi:LAO/AO transport system kinase
MTVASTGDGIEDVVLAAGEHLQWLIDTGNLARRREVRAREEILDTASALVRAELLEDRRGVDSLASEVAGGRMTAFEAAQRLLEEGPPGRMDA